MAATTFEPAVLLTGAAIAWQTAFELRETPKEGSLRVEIDGEPTDEFALAMEARAGTSEQVAVLSFELPPPPESRIDVRYRHLTCLAILLDDVYRAPICYLRHDDLSELLERRLVVER